MRINNATELEEAINALELKKKSQEKELVQHFHSTVEGLKPMNLIKSSLGRLGTSGVLGPVLKTAGSIGIGLLTSKLTGGTIAARGAKNIVGNILKQQAGRAVFNNVDKIKAYGAAIYKNLFTKK
jgi:hypothetical protein